MIAIYSDFNDELRGLWRSLQDEYDALVFQTLEWCECAWNTFCAPKRGERLHVIVWRGEKGESPVLLPTFIDRHATLRFIGDAHSDCGDALYLPGGNLYWPFRKIAEAIVSDKHVSAVCLQKFRRDSASLGYLGVLFKGALVYRDHAYSWLLLPEGSDFIDGQHQLRAKDRDRINTIKREFSGYVLSILSSHKGDAFPKLVIARLLEDMKRSGLRSKGFFGDNLMDFAQRIFEAGLCEIVVLRKDGKDLALSFQLRRGKRNHCWIFLYCDGRLNTLHRVGYLEKIAPQGGVFDFGVGAYGYKLGTFRPALDCTFSIRWGRGFPQKAYAYARMIWRFLRMEW